MWNARFQCHHASTTHVPLFVTPHSICAAASSPSPGTHASLSPLASRHSASACTSRVMVAPLATITAPRLQMCSTKPLGAPSATNLCPYRWFLALWHPYTSTHDGDIGASALPAHCHAAIRSCSRLCRGATLVPFSSTHTAFSAAVA